MLQLHLRSLSGILCLEDQLPTGANVLLLNLLLRLARSADYDSVANLHILLIRIAIDPSFVRSANHDAGVFLSQILQ